MQHCHEYQRKQDFKIFMKLRKKYSGILHWFHRHKSTNFINKYHHKPILWSNKLAYLAGLIDGEGYLKKEKWGTIRLVVGMCDRKTIYWIKRNFGGNITCQKTAKGKKFFVWRMNQGKDLFYLLFLILPFLVNKKQYLSLAYKQLITKFAKLDHTLYPSHYNKLRG
jgi:hypothetical protein